MEEEDYNKNIKKAFDTGYVQGLIDATKEWSVWNDGERTIGVMRKPLNDVIEEIVKNGRL